MKYIAVLLFFTVVLSGEKYAVIGNKNFKNLTPLEIKAIFLKKVKYIEGVKVVAVNLEASDPLRHKFQKKFLHMHFKQLQNYWMKQHYLGHRPPLSMKSQESVKTFVQKIEGAVGYVEIEYVDESVKVLQVWSD